MVLEGGEMKLPIGVSKNGYYEEFHQEVKKRINGLRNNAQSSFKWKYDSKLF